MYSRVGVSALIGSHTAQHSNSRMANPYNIGAIDQTTTVVRINAPDFTDGKEPLAQLARAERPPLQQPYAAAPDPIAKLEYGAQAQAKINAWLSTQPGTRSANGRRSPYIHRRLHRYNRSPQHNRGECLLVSVKKVSDDFKCTFMSAKGSDSYVHHVGLAANMFSVSKVYKRKHARMVSHRKNRQGALTLSHLCGNGSCCRAGHLAIEPKRVNDERTVCHTILRRAENNAQANLVQHLCPHQPKCFTNLYQLNTPYY